MKFEFGDLYRFLVSLGLALIGFSCVVPWLFLREPFDLLLKQAEFDALMSSAQSVINTRLGLVQQVMQYMPCFILGGLVVGVILLGAGTRLWWKKVQQLEDKEREQRFREKSIPLSAEESKAKRAEAIRSELTLVEPVDKQEVIERAINAEEKLLQAIQQCMSSSFDVLLDRKLGDLIFDAVLVARSKSDIDHVVDVKYLAEEFQYGKIRDAAQAAATRSAFYQKETGRVSRALLFIVVPRAIFPSYDLELYGNRLQEDLSNFARTRVAPLVEEDIGSKSCFVLEQFFQPDLNKVRGRTNG